MYLSACPYLDAYVSLSQYECLTMDIFVQMFLPACICQGACMWIADGKCLFLIFLYLDDYTWISLSGCVYQDITVWMSLYGWHFLDVFLWMSLS